MPGRGPYARASATGASAPVPPRYRPRSPIEHRFELKIGPSAPVAPVFPEHKAYILKTAGLPGLKGRFRAQNRPNSPTGAVPGRYRGCDTSPSTSASTVFDPSTSSNTSASTTSNWVLGDVLGEVLVELSARRRAGEGAGDTDTVPTRYRHGAGFLGNLSSKMGFSTRSTRSFRKIGAICRKDRVDRVGAGVFERKMALASPPCRYRVGTVSETPHRVLRRALHSTSVFGVR
jgi:hypothetical protein